MKLPIAVLLVAPFLGRLVGREHWPCHDRMDARTGQVPVDPFHNIARCKDRRMRRAAQVSPHRDKSRCRARQARLPELGA